MPGPEQVGHRQGQDRPQALASAQQGITHRLMEPAGPGGSGRDQLVDTLLDAVAVGLELGGEFHG